MILEERIPHTTSQQTAVTGGRSLHTGELSSKLFEKVLIPFELDSDSNALTSLATVLAAKFHSQFLIVDIAQHETVLARDPDVRQERRAKLEKIAEALRNAGAEAAETLLREGGPAHHIEQLTQEHGATVVLLFERTDQPAAHAWFGTLTQRLTRRMTTPLLVVKPDTSVALKSVLCVVDLSESSRLALKQALATAREAGAALTILHVVPEPLPFPLVEGPIWQGCAVHVPKENAAPPEEPGVYARKSSYEHTRLTQTARVELEEFLKGFDLADVTYDVEVTCGSPVVEILLVARAHKSGIIFVGTDQRGGFVHFVGQSTAETLAETADVPVLILRSMVERAPAYHGYEAIGKSIPVS